MRSGGGGWLPSELWLPSPMSLSRGGERPFYSEPCVAL